MRPHRRDHGATAVEYAIVAAFIAAVIFGTVTSLGLRTIALFSSLELP
jgi:Flp pilus assembly pilin Flp